jgi:hypothetical protein
MYLSIDFQLNKCMYFIIFNNTVNRKEKMEMVYKFGIGLRLNPIPSTGARLQRVST